ncbi:hypothetical protein MSC49_35620 [Methylosinus sp. C49]|nr:hypothetical protein MSC49_35620 [Methylosinus sp. C49]
MIWFRVSVRHISILEISPAGPVSFTKAPFARMVRPAADAPPVAFFLRHVFGFTPLAASLGFASLGFLEAKKE